MTYTATVENSMPLPVEPGVISCYVPNAATEINVPVFVPWKSCRLVHAYAVVVTAIDTAGAMEIDLELNAAGGTELMSITVAAASAVGTQAEATISSATDCKDLDRTNTDKDEICIEVDGSASAAGGAMVYMYFEPEVGQ